jgi:hypothetical protein
MILVNPLDETQRPRGRPAPRLATLEGKTIALLDISKPGGRFFLDRLEALLAARAAVRAIVRAAKPTFARPAPEELIRRLLEPRCDAVVEALAD